jgi:hypothetical protein
LVVNLVPEWKWLLGSNPASSKFKTTKKWNGISIKVEIRTAGNTSKIVGQRIARYMGYRCSNWCNVFKDQPHR